MTGDDHMDQLAVHSTRVRRRVRRALELLVRFRGETYQDMTDAALTAYLRQHHPEALEAAGDNERELELASRYAAEQARAEGRG